MIHVPPVAPEEPPFVAEVFPLAGSGDRFVPACRVRLGTGFRRLASHLAPVVLRDLAVVVSFATANGVIAPTSADFSGSVGVPVWLGRLRLFRLALTHWEGEPLVRALRRPSGLVTFSPGATICAIRQELPTTAALASAAPARGQAVRESSRQQYARPREDVEREIIARQGWPSLEEMQTAAASRPPMPDDLNGTWAVNRLMRLGVDYTLALKLVREYGAERCLRQCQWLEYRSGSVKNRRRYVVAAIQGNYAGPVGVSEPAGSLAKEPPDNGR